jgi:tRNA A-37 threonylcarbamoyl transferase component Bud32
MQIKAMADLAKANTEQCQLLSERVQIINGLIQRLKEGNKELTGLQAALNQTEKCLTECLNFIRSFAKKEWYKRFLGGSSHKEKFQKLTDEVQRCISTLTLGLAIDLDVSKTFDRTRDIQAEARDLAKLDQLQQLILNEHQKEQAELQRLYDLEHEAKEAESERAKRQQQRDEFLQQQLASIRENLARLPFLAAPPIIAPGLPVAGAPAPSPTLPVDKSLIIPLVELDMLDVIGEGTSAIVYAGKLYGEDVAIKKLRQLTPETRAELFREATILARLKGVNVVRCYGVCIEPGNECLIMENMQGGSLFTYLLDSSKPLSPQLQKQWAIEIVEGIASIHKQHTIHRDLKSANILLTRELHAKLADFDLSIMGTSSLAATPYKSQAFTYMAPELKSLHGEATPASDIYNYGVILLEILTRKPAPLEKTPSIFITIPEPYNSIIKSCLEDNPSQRLNLETIISTLTAFQPMDCRALYQQGAEHEKAGRFEAAYTCYLQSANSENGGYERSEFRLAMFSLQGKTGAPDKRKALEYFIKAASHPGHDQAKACFNAALMLEKGDGVPQNFLQAYRWYNEAAKLGDAAAQAKAEEVKRIMSGEPQDNQGSIRAVTTMRPTLY